MSTRDYKGFATGEWYHLFTRGNGKMDIFRDEQDYQNFLKRLRMALGKDEQIDRTRGALVRYTSRWEPGKVRIAPFEQGAFSIAAYCLMPNHFHFLIRQNDETPISKLLLKLLTSYSMYFNRRYEHVGHVFQDRFKAVHVKSDTQLKHVSAYIHLNPKVSRLVRDAVRWKYSSYPEYIGGDTGGLCDKKAILEQFRSVREYEHMVQESYDVIKRNKSMAEYFIDHE